MRNKLNLVWFEPSFDAVLQKKVPIQGPPGTFFTDQKVRDGFYGVKSILTSDNS